MLTLTGARNLLRAIGDHTVRVLIAVEPAGLRRHAQRNAADAVALAAALRLEAEDVHHWLTATPDPGKTQTLRANG